MKTSIGESLLDKTIGEQQQQIYTRVIFLIHLIVLCTLGYFIIGSMDVFISDMESIGASSGGNGTVNISNSVLSYVILNGLILSVIFRVIVYRKLNVFSVSRLFKDGILTSLSYLFWLFLLFVFLFGLFTVVGNIFEILETNTFYTHVFQGASYFFTTVISSGVAAVISSLGGSWRFPSSLRTRVEESHEKVDEIDDCIKNAKKELSNHSFVKSNTSLKSANSKLKNVKNNQIPFQVINRRIRDCEKNIEQVAEEIVEYAISTTEKNIEQGRYQLALTRLDRVYRIIESSGPPNKDHKESIGQVAEALVGQAISSTEQAIDNKEYQAAQTTLDTISETIDLFKIKNKGKEIQSLQEEINIRIKDVIQEKRKETNAQIKQAATAGDRGDFNQAYNNIESAKKLISEIRTIGEQEIAGDIDSQIDEVEKRVSQLEDEKNISDIRDSISDSHRIEKSKVKIDQGTPRSYNQLETLLDRIESSKSTNDSLLPWDEFKSSIVADLPGISGAQIVTYHKIISDIQRIVKFLDTVNESHPSVYGDEWRNAAETALINQNRDILNPATSQISRLQSNTLWEKEDLYKVNWEEFEYIIGSLYENLGYDVEVTQGTNDMGVDVWATKEDSRIAIQVKQFSDGNTVGRETLQKLTSTIAKGDAEGAVVVTSGDFARTADQYAEDFGSKLEIIDGDELVQMLSESDVPTPV